MLESQARSLRSSLAAQLAEVDAFLSTLQTATKAKPIRKASPKPVDAKTVVRVVGTLTDDDAVAIVRDHGPGKLAQIAQRAGVNATALSIALRKAVQAGAIRKTGKNRGTVYAPI